MKTCSLSTMYNYRAKLVRVVDGDTIDLMIDLGFGIYHKARVRLLGINTPETRTRNPEEKVRGFAAKDRVKELVIEDCIVATTLDKKGKYGRILGTIFIEQPDETLLNINDTLLNEGHATIYPS